MLLHVLGVVFPIFAIVALGFLYGRRRRPDMVAANRLNLEVFTPALILSVLAGKDFQLGEFQALALAGVVVVLGSGVLAWPIARLLGYAPRTFVPPMMFTNSGNMGLPLAYFAFGPEALPAALVLFLVENLLHFTVGNAMLEGRVHPLVLLRMPMLQATVAGLAVGLSGLDLPKPLLEAIDLLGQVSIPLMLFALGVRLSTADLGEWRIGALAAVAAPVIGVALALLLVPLFGLQGIYAGTLVLFGALPPAVLNFMLAEKYRQEPSKVASIVIVGNLFAVVAIPLALAYVLPRYG